MRIGISSPYLDSFGGGERYMLTIASCLAKEHAVEVFWPDEKIKRIAKDRLAIDLGRVEVIPEESQNYDLLIFLSDGSIPLSFTKNNIVHFQRPFQNVGGETILNKIKLLKINKVICNSEFTKKFIDQEYGVKSIIIYPPVDVKKFAPRRKSNTILSVGRFHPAKKQFEMIEMYKRIIKGLNGWRLILTGGLLGQDKEYYSRLRALANDKDVEILPNVEFVELVRLYGKAKIYWHATGYGEDEEKNPAAMEHFGITTVEAMAAGCVPITFRGGGQKEIIKHTHNGFLWETSGELKKYTLEMVENEKLRKEIATQARKDSGKYSVKRFCNEISNLVDRI